VKYHLCGCGPYVTHNHVGFWVIGSVDLSAVTQHFRGNKNLNASSAEREVADAPARKKAHTSQLVIDVSTLSHDHLPPEIAQSQTSC
jgi:hypothetical protein